MTDVFVNNSDYAEEFTTQSIIVVEEYHVTRWYRQHHEAGTTDAASHGRAAGRA
jgi:hypothetical protein